MSETSGPVQDKRRLLGNIIRGAIGNVLEWYDWFTYAIFAIYFAGAFFPQGNKTAQLLSTAVVFAVGYFARPLGAWLLGMYADRYGRRAALTVSVTMISVGSLIIAVTPNYREIGVFAPILLVVARLVQGLSAGGEYGSAASYLSEIAPRGRRGFFASFHYVSIGVGQLSALVIMILLQQLLSDEQLTEWGWRIPFAIGALMGLLVMYLRRTMDETQHFLAEKARLAKAGNERRGLRSLVTEYPRQLMAVIGICIGGVVASYTFTTYMQKYLVNTAGLPKETVSVMIFVALLIFTLIQPLMGALSDRIGRRPVMLIFSVGGMVATVPVMTILGHATNPWTAFLLLLGVLVILSGYTAVGAIIKAEMFTTKVRSLGIGLAQAVVTATVGGLTESIALSLKQVGHESMFYWYVTGCIAITFVTVLAIREPSRNSALDEVGETPSVRVS